VALGTAERAALLRETLRTTIAVRLRAGTQRRVKRSTCRMVEVSLPTNSGYSTGEQELCGQRIKAGAQRGGARAGEQGGRTGRRGSQGLVRRGHRRGVDVLAAGHLGTARPGRRAGRRRGACPQRGHAAPGRPVGRGRISARVRGRAARSHARRSLDRRPAAERIVQRAPAWTCRPRARRAPRSARCPVPGRANCGGTYLVCTDLKSRFRARRLESIFFGGMRGEVWIEPGKPPSQARAAPAAPPLPARARAPDVAAGVCSPRRAGGPAAATRLQSTPGAGERARAAARRARCTGARPWASPAAARWRWCSARAIRRRSRRWMCCTSCSSTTRWSSAR
jgi:hypothetical protein